MSAHEFDETNGDIPELCDNCRQVPLSPSQMELFEGAAKPDKSAWYLGVWNDLKQRNCPLCQLIASTHPDDFGNHRDSWEVSVGYIERGIFRLTCPSDAVLLCCSHAYDNNYVRARKVHTKLVEPRIIQRWLRFCQTHHEHLPRSCSPLVFQRLPDKAASTGLHVLRMIDVHAMRIIEAPDACQYVALSYVWGKTSNERLVLTTENLEYLMTKGSLTAHKGMIANTIWDAIELVRIIGVPYLWVDSLCLVQNDFKELRHSIDKMDLVYEMATLTIIAAAGNDATAGLPGVCSTPRLDPILTRQVKADLWMTATLRSEFTLDHSTYSTRAWTLQEQRCTHRILVFTNNQLFYQCENSLFTEDMTLDEQDEDAKLFDHLVYQYGEQGPYIHRSNIFTHFIGVVHDYMRRELTYDSDVLRGISGLLNRVSVLHGVHIWQGLPLPLASWMHFQRVQNSQQTPITKSSSANTRRAGFPSYSWIGWKHEIAWRFAGAQSWITWEATNCENIPQLPTWPDRAQTDLTQFSSYPEHSLRWFASSYRQSPSQYCSFSEPARRIFGTHYRNSQAQGLPHLGHPQEIKSVRPYSLLKFATLCFRAQVKGPCHHDELLAGDDYPWSEGQFRILGLDGTVLGLLHLDAWTPESLDDQVHDFAIISYSTVYAPDGTVLPDLHPTAPEFFALMLLWDGPIAERRGVTSFREDVFIEKLADSCTWKNILLG